MSKLYFVTHPEVKIDPKVPVPQWHLSDVGKKRMLDMCEKQPWVRSIDVIYSSTERKAAEGALIVANLLSKQVFKIKDLGEIDRSSTGYSPEKDFWPIVKRFFEHPDDSPDGWEKARNAQVRIAVAIDVIIETNPGSNILVVSHGAVGALLLALLTDEPISLKLDQNGAGNFLVLDTKTEKLVHGWRKIDEL